MLEWFITGGVDLDRHGAAALHQAASSGRLDLVRLLLDLNVPVDARDSAGATTLLHGARAGQVDVVQFLLARGAERYPRDREGRGIEAYMAMAVGPIAAMIEQREQVARLLADRTFAAATRRADRAARRRQGIAGAVRALCTRIAAGP